MPDKPNKPNAELVLTRKRQAETKLLKLRYQREIGKLVPIETVQATIAEVLDGIRQELLWIPTQFDDPAVARRVKELIAASLARIANRAHQ